MAATSASVPAAPATAASALCLGTRFIYNEVSPAKILTVQGVHRAIRVFVIGHFNEGEPARLSRKAVANQIDARGSYTDLRKPLVELLLRRGKRKISDIELLHPLTPSVRNLKCESRSALKIQLSFSGGPEFRPTLGARPWLQRSVASSRKLTAFATEIVPQPLAALTRAALPPPFPFAPD
jgi:hypothetical protein